DEREVGLRSIREAREKRERRQSRVTPQQMLFLLLTAVTVVVIYEYVSGRNLDAGKDKLLQKQRAVAATVGAEWTGMRDRLEKITLEDAAAFKGDFVDSEAARWDFRGLPGIYLRVRVADVTDVESLRRAAQKSARDSFAGCLLREPNAPLAH